MKNYDLMLFLHWPWMLFNVYTQTASDLNSMSHNTQRSVFAVGLR